MGSSIPHKLIDTCFSLSYIFLFPYHVDRLFDMVQLFLYVWELIYPSRNVSVEQASYHALFFT